MSDHTMLQWSCSHLLKKSPYAKDFFDACGLSTTKSERTVADLLTLADPARLEALGFDQAKLVERFLAYMHQMDQLNRNQTTGIRSVTIMGGRNKKGRREKLNIKLNAGEIICVVGPTGAGKSMLLSDIECLAQGDSPSNRKILIDGRIPDDAQRFSGEQRLVAQLSQNMNFVMDLSVKEFLLLHAESRLVKDVDGTVNQVFQTAVRLAGEPFFSDTAVTSLSGGQSRALMIADVACLSTSPIVLIDEIENAGVDRKQALDLLVKKEKIVIMATHDPLLALSGNRRLVIHNGGIMAVLETTPAERLVLKKLDAVDARIALLRHRLRLGEQLTTEVFYL
jgi:ABC-type lipoprotein export system ATPase subunit